MKKAPLVIYHHPCADGMAAAWAVRLALPNAEFVPSHYGTNPPDVTGRDVILVDFSYSADVLREMSATANTILVIDHHESAANDLGALRRPPKGAYRPDSWSWNVVEPTHCPVFAIFDMTHSGCVLAFHYFNPLLIPPLLLLHLEDRDLWRFHMHGTEEIQAAVFSHPFDIDVYDRLMAMDVEKLYRDGKPILRKYHRDIDEILSAQVRLMTIAGHEVPVVNCSKVFGSDAANELCKRNPDAPFTAYYYDRADCREISLRTIRDDVNVAEIAETYGGGGHRKAAGFITALDWNGDITIKEVTCAAC